MIAPSKRMAERLAWELCVHAIGAAGAVAVISGVIVVIANVDIGLIAIVAGVGLLCICWGLTGRVRVTMPPASRPALPVRPDGSPQRFGRPGSP